MKSSFPLSQKYIDFVNTTKGVTAEFLEGTTASGKTTVGAGVKFMRMVSASQKKLHVIAAKTTGRLRRLSYSRTTVYLTCITMLRITATATKTSSCLT